MDRHKGCGHERVPPPLRGTVSIASLKGTTVLSLQNALADLLRRVRRHVGADAALLLIGSIGAALFTGLLVASGTVYDNVTDADGVSGLDQPALDLAIRLRTPVNQVWVTYLTNLGDTLPMIIFGLLLTGGMYWRWRRRSIFVLTGIAAAGSVTFTVVGKALVGRTRPPLPEAVAPYEYAPSFPSGHTLNSTVVALMLAYIAVWLGGRLWIRLVCPLVAAVWAAAIGLSRVFLGHHWLTDVIFGWLFGLAWIALIITRPPPPARARTTTRRYAFPGDTCWTGAHAR